MSVMNLHREMSVPWIFAGLVVVGLIWGSSLWGFETAESRPPASEAWPGNAKHRGMPTAEGESALPLEYDRGDPDVAENVLFPVDGEPST